MVLRLSLVQLLVVYLITVCKFLENNYLNSDGIYAFKFKNEIATCHYLVSNVEVCVFKHGTMMVSAGGVVQSITPASKDPVGHLVYKYRYEDPKVPGYCHKIRIYSNGVIIHTSKLFSFKIGRAHV